MIRGYGLFYDPNPCEKPTIRAYFRDFHPVLEPCFKYRQCAVFTLIEARIVSVYRHAIALFFSDDVYIDRGGDRGVQGFCVDCKNRNLVVFLIYLSFNLPFGWIFNVIDLKNPMIYSNIGRDRIGKLKIKTGDQKRIRSSQQVSSVHPGHTTFPRHRLRFASG